MVLQTGNGAKAERGLLRALDQFDGGEVLTVTRLDSLARFGKRYAGNPHGRFDERGWAGCIS